MNLLYLATWSTILRVLAPESTMPLISYANPAQALEHMRFLNNEGQAIRVITNDGEWYWLVSATLAERLCASGFCSLSDADYQPERVWQSTPGSAY